MRATNGFRRMFPPPLLPTGATYLDASIPTDPPPISHLFPLPPLFSFPVIFPFVEDSRRKREKKKRTFFFVPSFKIIANRSMNPEDRLVTGRRAFFFFEKKRANKVDAWRRRAAFSMERGRGGAARRPGAQTELSQYSLGLLALLFDKSCRNLSRGHFQRYCRKPPRLPPIVRPPCTAFSGTADCDPQQLPLSSMPIQLVNSSVFSPHLCILRGHCCILHFSRVPLSFSLLIGEEFHPNLSDFLPLLLS